MRHRLLGMDIDAIHLPEACARCAEAIERRAPLMIGCVNAAKIVKTRQDPVLHDAVASCDLIVADGMSVVWASRLLGAPLPERVAGIDLFEALLAEGDRRQWSIYFFGATEEVLGQVLEHVRREHPGVRIAGSHHGYVDDEGEKRVAGEIRAAAPDLLFLGMGTPKKELFIRAHGRETGAVVCHGVGGSFDVLAGKVQRAPAIWQRLGLEWLYRTLQEPGRLWWRYLSTNTRFVWLVLRERLGMGTGAPPHSDPDRG